MNKASNRITLVTTFAGILLILIGVLVPSLSLVRWLRDFPPEMQAQFQFGGTLFRIGLLFHGLLLVVLPRLRIWGSKPDSRVERAAQPNTKTVIWLLVALLAVSLLVRLYELGAGLWLDEILTHVKYARLSYGEIVTTFDSENQHFLFTLLTHTSYLIFGESAWTLRLPAVLFGVASIWALFLLGGELSGPREGLLAAALLAFTYHHVWFSQNARGYTGLLLWTILSSWLLVRGLSHGRLKDWLFYALAAALGVYTHLTMGFVLVGHLIIYLATIVARRKQAWENRWLGLCLGFGLTGSFIYQLHALVFPQVMSGLAGTVSVVAEWRNPLWTLYELARGLQVSFASGFVAVGALLLFGAGLWSFTKTRPVLIGLLVLPPVIGASIVIAAGHHLWPRFFFFAFGFGALVVVRGALTLAELAAWLAQRYLGISAPKLGWLGVTMCASMILVSALSVPFAYGPKQDYGSALEYIQENLQPGDLVVTTYLADFVYEQYYQTGWQAVDSLVDLNELRAQANRTWLVYTFLPVLESVNPEIVESIEQDFQVLKEFPGSVGSGDVVVCRADEPPLTASSK